MFDLDRLTALCAAHFSVARVVVVGVKGSTPRGIGTAMFVWESGQEGTIGGGALEFEAVEQARAVLGGYEPGLKRYALGPDMAQCCGGAVTLLTEVFKPTQIPNFSYGYARRVEGDGPVPSQIQRALERSEAMAKPAPHLFSGGWLLEPVQVQAHTVNIYGAGHVGQALADVLDLSPDFQPVLADDRESLATSHDRPRVSIQSALDTAQADTLHFVMTHSHDLDLAICHELLSKPSRFIGLIGSKTKAARFRKRLSNLGHAEADLSRITSPIGDPDLGKHPQAIALGVASELMRMINSGATKTLGGA